MSFELYGSFRSRTRRPIWAALETGADFRHIPLTPADPTLKEPAFRQINPLGRVPVFKEGGRTFSESLAINLHIAKTYGEGLAPPLYPVDAEAKILQWSFFAASDLDPWVTLFRMHSDVLPKDQRDSALRNHGQQLLQRGLGHLEAHLSSAPFLAADHFTIADLNVASVLQPLVFGNYAFGDFPAVEAWLTESLNRPAARAASEFP